MSINISDNLKKRLLPALKKSAGSFFLELAIVLPVLLLLVLGALEFHLYMRTAHKLTIVKREALKMSFHHCRHYIGDPADWGEMDGCLRLRVIDNVVIHAGVIFKDIKIMYSFYGLSSGGIISKEAQEEWSSPESELSTQQSRFDALRVTNELKPVMAETGAVILVEIWVPSPGVLRGVLGDLLGDVRYTAGVV